MLPRTTFDNKLNLQVNIWNLHFKEEEQHHTTKNQSKQKPRIFTPIPTQVVSKQMAPALVPRHCLIFDKSSQREQCTPALTGRKTIDTRS